jgi:hypothetical protein
VSQTHPIEGEPNPFRTAPPSDSQRPPETNTGRCLLFGCIGVFVTGLLLIVCAGFGTYFAVQKQVEKYTSTEPVNLPTVEYSEEELETLQARLESFEKTLKPETPPVAANSEAAKSDAAVAEDGQQPAEVADTDLTPTADPPVLSELVLTADDINALIATNPKLKGCVYVAIADDKISGEISVPIESFIPGSKGRYLNASATFDVSLDGGVLVVTLDSANVKGEPIPDAIMQALRKENLAKDLYKDKENVEIIRRFDSIRIEDDKIIAKLKQEP